LNYYSDDSIDRDINFRNRERRDRTRFSNGDRSGGNYQRRNEENDRTRDQDLDYLNREQASRLTREQRVLLEMKMLLIC